MLKIKDSVDLKELEKFGFKENYIIDSNAYTCGYVKGNYKEDIIVWEKNREIQVEATNILDVLYDLIKADMVEKVEEENNES